MFAGVGLYLQVWAVACGSELIFAGLGYCLQVWAYLSIPSGFIFAGSGLYFFCICTFGLYFVSELRSCSHGAQRPGPHICRFGLLFAGLSLYLQVWTYFCTSGVIFSRHLVLYPYVLLCICRFQLMLIGLGFYEEVRG
jgi:hypothetical protein